MAEVVRHALPGCESKSEPFVCEQCFRLCCQCLGGIDDEPSWCVDCFNERLAEMSGHGDICEADE